MAVEELSDESVIARTTEVARRRWRDAVVSDVRRLEGGVSSLTFAARISIGDGVKDVVLKLAPPGLEPLGNRDV
ncbi:MAG TPA: phosphotransferase, partial [Mycobacterium sp.]|nr:phosphotransferase [Mycobacterium sp.]